MADRRILTKRSKDEVWVENGVVACRVCKKNGVHTQEFYASRDGEWKLIAQSINPSIVEASNFATPAELSISVNKAGTVLGAPDSITGIYESADLVKENEDLATLLLAGEWQGFKIYSYITVFKESDFIKVHTKAVPPQHTFKMEYFLATYAFTPDGGKLSEYQKPDFIWVPNLRPGDDMVIGDHVFRAPALVLQKDSLVERASYTHNI